MKKQARNKPGRSTGGAFLGLAMATALGACTVPKPLAPACRPWQNGNSTEPPAHCLFFPGNAVLDPLGDILYATNTNADKSFGGSTVVAIDVLRHERAAACFRKLGRDDNSGSAPDPDCGNISCLDSGWALGNTAYIEDVERKEASSTVPIQDFDRCYCDWDIVDPNIINCESHRFVLADETVKIGDFPGELRILSEDPPNWSAATSADKTTLRRGLYLAVRGDPSITLVDVKRPLLPGRTANRAAGISMDCGGDKGGFTQHEPGQPYTLHLCSDSNRIQQTPDEVLIDPNDINSGTKPRFLLPAEPMGVHIDRGCVERGFHHDRGTFYKNDAAQNPKNRPPCYTDDGMGDCQRDAKTGECIEGTYYQYLVASHLETGQISSFDLGGSPIAPVPPRLQDVSDALLPPVDGTNRRGGIGLASRLPGDLSQPWYLTSKVSGNIASFRLASAAGPRVVPGLGLNIAGQFSLNNDEVRDVLFSADGNHAYVALYTPPALAILDTSIRGDSGVPVNQIENIVNLCVGPSRVALATVPRREMDATVLATRIYVTCYLSGQVAEVDGESGELISTMTAGRGPLSMSLNFGQANGGTAIDPCADPYVSDGEAQKRGITCPAMGQPDLRIRPTAAPSPLGPRAYVTAYLDNSIAVLDLDPRSPSYRRVVSRIGLPIPKQVQ